MIRVDVLLFIPFCFIFIIQSNKCICEYVEKAENQFITSVLYLLHVYTSYGNHSPIFLLSFPTQIKELLKKGSTKNCIKYVHYLIYFVTTCMMMMMVIYVYMCVRKCVWIKVRGKMLLIEVVRRIRRGNLFSNWWTTGFSYMWRFEYTKKNSIFFVSKIVF